ncbi:hypothetical protein SAMN05421595_2746 [Austwickia chelonae]|uniref:Uncharacterized protein n=1 Tax=Austwickia chelonae NBRC 105200 TaxID=1184607 RepID=K6UMW8_9MICO|nr:DUF6301 family protein [Austwickia chelonae]GAB78476.1 hypothetical protein AUCHE_09_00810 [Austwickia chelonae NBRC 105200]SEW39944.1 hypothetical protein SAMN05421595_2746 [Austwickia chelonae]
MTEHDECPLEEAPMRASMRLAPFEAMSNWVRTLEEVSWPLTESALHETVGRFGWGQFWPTEQDDQVTGVEVAVTDQVGVLPREEEQSLALNIFADVCNHFRQVRGMPESSVCDGSTMMMAWRLANDGSAVVKKASWGVTLWVMGPARAEEMRAEPWGQVNRWTSWEDFEAALVRVLRDQLDARTRVTFFSCGDDGEPGPTVEVDKNEPDWHESPDLLISGVTQGVGQSLSEEVSAAGWEWVEENACWSMRHLWPAPWDLYPLLARSVCVMMRSHGVSSPDRLSYAAHRAASEDGRLPEEGVLFGDLGIRRVVD